MIMNKVLSILSCVSLAFFSCGSRTQYYSPDVVAIKETTETIDSLSFNKQITMGAMIQDIQCIDNILIITQENRDTIFVVIDTKSDSIIARFGRIGHARNEFTKIPDVVYCIRAEDGSPKLCVSEDACTKVIDLQKSIDAQKCVISEIIKEKSKNMFYQTYHIGKKKEFIYKEVSYDDPRDGIFYPPEFSFKYSDIKKWNIFPQIIRPSFANFAPDNYYNCIAVSPNGAHAVSVNLFVDIVTIFDFEKLQAIGVVNPNSYTLEYIEKQITESNVRDIIRLYNFSACATDKCYIIIEDGRTLKEKENKDIEENENLGTMICGYNWDGKLQFACRADKCISEIAYCEMNHKLYAVGLYSGNLYVVAKE